jgi:two-component system sensor histidine kinase KdpD
VPARRHAYGWPSAIVLPVVATVLGVLLRESVDLSTDVVLFFLATVITAMIGGLAPALLAAIGGGLLLNVFLTPPLYTLSVAQPENAFAIVAMVVVAALVAAVVDRADRRAVQAAQARTEATLLASFARVVLSRSDPLPKLLERVREAFGLTAVALLERSGSAWEVTACTGPAPCTTPGDADADVEIDEGVHLVGSGRTLTASENALFGAVSGQALLALRNRRMAAEATDAQRRADAAGLRTALLSAVGHDLRTPLTAIKAAAGSLRDPTLRMSTTDRQELLATVEESADRLTGLVDNLLDSSRLATGAVSPVAEPVGLDEVVAAAMTSVHGDAGRVAVEVGEDLPDVLADAGLAERVVANLVDNALRHGGDGTVAVRASAYADRVELRVVDGGPGVPRKQRDRLFTPFQQLGDRRSATGVGLGLHVARGFAEAMGGTLDAEDTPGGGLTMVLSLPAAPRGALVP